MGMWRQVPKAIVVVEVRELRWLPPPLIGIFIRIKNPKYSTY